MAEESKPRLTVAEMMERMRADIAAMSEPLMPPPRTIQDTTDAVARAHIPVNPIPNEQLRALRALIDVQERIAADASADRERDRKVLGATLWWSRGAVIVAALGIVAAVVIALVTLG